MRFCFIENSKIIICLKVKILISEKINISKGKI